MKWIVGFSVLVWVASSLWAKPGTQWRVGPRESSLIELANLSNEPLVLRVVLLPNGPTAGSISRAVRLQHDEPMRLSVRHLLLDQEPGRAQGQVRILVQGPQGSLKAEMWVNDSDLGITRESLSDELLRAPRGEDSERCNRDSGCELDTDYFKYADFDYKEWDVTGDGITDSELESSFIVYDSLGFITYADAISEWLPYQQLQNAYHSSFCSEYPSGACTVKQCLITTSEFSSETGWLPIAADFIQIRFCGSDQPEVRVLEEPMPLQEPSKFYSSCVEQASRHFNQVMDQEVETAKSEIVTLLWDTVRLTASAAGVQFGGLLQDPGRMLGRIARGAPVPAILYASLRSIDRANQALVLVREQACGWVVGERVCAQHTEDLFGVKVSPRVDVYELLERKNVDSQVVRRHCK